MTEPTGKHAELIAELEEYAGKILHARASAVMRRAAAALREAQSERKDDPAEKGE